MGGIGSPPKPPGTKAGHSKDVVSIRVLPASLAEQPDLPEFDVWSTYKDADSGQIVTEKEPYSWSPQTTEWWRMWEASPLTAEFTSTDWAELLDTAYIHSEYWKGKLSLAAELRLRTARFGATAADRLRLRIQFAEAVGAEVTTSTKIASARKRFSGMTVPAEIESA